MTQDLGSALNCDRMCQEGTFTLITQTDQIDSNFLSSYLLVRHLSSGRDVLLVTFQHTFPHYVNVASKFGLNLRSLREQGKLVVIEALKSVDQDLRVAARHGSVDLAGSLLGQSVSVAGLCDAVRDAVRGFPDTDNHCAVVIDDLSVMVTIGVPLTDVHLLVHCCRKLCWSRGCLVVSVRRDRHSEDTDLSQLCSLLTHECDVSLTLAELVSGFSNDVHGEMEIWWRNKSLKSAETKVTKHYKIEERKIIVFAPGTSAAVL